MKDIQAIKNGTYVDEEPLIELPTKAAAAKEPLLQEEK